MKKIYTVLKIFLLIFFLSKNSQAASVIWIGTFSNQWDNKKNWNCQCIPSNGDDIYIQPGPIFSPVITAGSANSFIPRNIIIQNVGTLQQTGGNLSLTGNWTNDGTFIPSSGTSVTFIGNTQKISGTAITNFYNLVISLSSSGGLVTLDTNAIVTYSLILNNGGLFLNGKILFVTNSSLNAIVRNVPAYIKSETNFFPYGELKRTVNNNIGTYIFPFGISATNYIPFIFDIEIAGSSNGTVSVSTYATIPTNTPFPSGVTELKSNGTDNSANVVDRFWNISVEGFATKPKASVTFSYLESEIPSNGEDELVAQRWDGTQWEQPDVCVPEGQTCNTIANTLTAKGIVNFSPWTLSRKVSPLPVSFLNFEGRQEEEKINLYWTTATEINNDYFSIERSEDGFKFEVIGQVDGAENSSSIRNYFFQDISPDFRNGTDGIFYYRIKQTDFDGKFSYSKIISARFQNSTLPFYIFPNPSDGKEIFFRLNSAHEMPWQISVLDFSGREVFSRIISGEELQCRPLLLEKKLVCGNYFIAVKSGDTTYRKKLVVK